MGGPLFDDALGNGYNFEVSLLDTNHFGLIDRKMFEVTGRSSGGRAHITLTYAHSQQSSNTLDGRHRIWGIGKEACLSLPDRYALQHTFLDNDRLVVYAREHIERAPRDQYHDLQRGAVPRSWTSPQFREALEGGHFDLTEFYGREQKLDNMLDRARNQLVLVQASNPEIGQHFISLSVDSFVEYDIAEIMREMFVRMHAGHSPDLPQYFRPVP